MVVLSIQSCCFIFYFKVILYSVVRNLYLHSLFTSLINIFNFKKSR